jgi:hypothetical protein
VGRPPVPLIAMLGSDSWLSRRQRLRYSFVRSELSSIDPSHTSLASTLVFVNERLRRVEGLPLLAILGIEGLLSMVIASADADPNTDCKRAAKLIRRSDAMALPAITDYVRLVRSLVLVSIYEARLASTEHVRRDDSM